MNSLQMNELMQHGLRSMDIDDAISHYGVKGMKWRHRKGKKEPPPGTPHSKDTDERFGPIEARTRETITRGPDNTTTIKRSTTYNITPKSIEEFISRGRVWVSNQLSGPTNKRGGSSKSASRKKK